SRRPRFHRLPRRRRVGAGHEPGHRLDLARGRAPVRPQAPRVRRDARIQLAARQLAGHGRDEPAPLAARGAEDAKARRPADQPDVPADSAGGIRTTREDVKLSRNVRHNLVAGPEIPPPGRRLPGRSPGQPREDDMTAFRLLTLVTLTLGIVFPVAAGERAPAPRDVSPDRFIDPVVRKIDRHLDAFWDANKITPAPRADDAEYLRRLSLDLVGRIPTASEARAFIESKDPDKRNKKIDELLSRPGYLNHFATTLRQLWIPQASGGDRLLQFIAPQFEGWIRTRLRDNVPMDKIVRDMLTVPTLFAGRGAQTFENGQGESPFLFVQANEFKPENVAAAASRLFLGVKIECAQCHNHPFAPYKKEQFWELAAFFAEVQPAIANISEPKYKREIRIPDTPKTVQARFFNDSRQPQWDDKKSPR